MPLITSALHNVGLAYMLTIFTTISLSHFGV